MIKFKKLASMLCLVLLGAWSYAHNTDKTEKNEDGTPIEVIERASYSHSEKGNAIIPTINGHVLSVVFTDNLGQVAVEVSTAIGTSVHYSLTPTPTGIQVYLANTGDYIITFTLSNGDEYYGEFTVTN